MELEIIVYIPLPEGTLILLPEGTVKITLKTQHPSWLALTVAGAVHTVERDDTLESGLCYGGCRVSY